MLVGLLLAFGVNLGIFTATYDQQARVDAQLTVGADVVTTAPPGLATRNHLPARIARTRKKDKHNRRDQNDHTHPRREQCNPRGRQCRLSWGLWGLQWQRGVQFVSVRFFWRSASR